VGLEFCSRKVGFMGSPEQLVTKIKIIHKQKTILHENSSVKDLMTSGIRDISILGPRENHWCNTMHLVYI
jgi:hypothetical protein